MVLHEPTFPHPGKTEYMLLTRGRHFVGPLQQISPGGNTVKLVEFSRCLGVQLDNELKWDTHVNELIKSYTKTLNLLRSLHFLLVKPIEQMSTLKSSYHLLHMA